MPEKTMKAVLLAGGKGERLGKITREIPKPMLPVAGKPVIVHNIEMCRRAGITDIYITLQHLAGVITGYLGDGRDLGVTISYFREEAPLGTAGGVKLIADKLRDERFFIIYADNYSNYDLKQINDSHLSAGADMSLALFQLENTSQSGVAVIDENGWIEKFVEKPENDVDSHWVSAGIYLMEPALAGLIPDGPSDFGRDIIPQYIAGGYKLLGVKMTTPVLAIDTPELLEEINRQT